MKYRKLGPAPNRMVSSKLGKTLVSTVPVTKWFVRKRGKALAIMSLGNPIGGLIFIPLTQIFIADLGWRDAWFYLAIIGASLILPLSIVLVRREPEDMGLLPDGDRPRPAVRPAGTGQPAVTAMRRCCHDAPTSSARCVLRWPARMAEALHFHQMKV